VTPQFGLYTKTDLEIIGKKMTEMYTGECLFEGSAGRPAWRENKWPEKRKISRKSDDDLSALKLVRRDLERQLGLASDRQNTLLQSVGILVAFSSILFLQSLTMNPAFNGSGVLFFVSMICAFLCCLLGVVTVLTHRLFISSTGINIKEGVQLYNNKKTTSLEEKIMEGVDRAYSVTFRNNARFIEILTYMVFLLVIAMVTMLAGWCLI
jgi:hypothetical protein